MKHLIWILPVLLISCATMGAGSSERLVIQQAQEIARSEILLHNQETVINEVIVRNDVMDSHIRELSTTSGDLREWGQRMSRITTLMAEDIVTIRGLLEISLDNNQQLRDQINELIEILKEAELWEIEE